MTVRTRIRVAGQVQGVGFRPFVYRLAHELGLSGWVRNDSSGVEIVVEGEQAQVLRLLERLQSEPPALARVENIALDWLPDAAGMQGFQIVASQSGSMQTQVPPDMAICPDCLAELFDHDDRRYRHAFINCIHCGPRFTLIRRLPYDRANTSMAKFAQCPDCQREYEDPATRRFHAQPNACPACGPELQLYDENFQPVAVSDAIAATAELILDGRIVAIKGVGGFHLVFDARNSAALDRVRCAKLRDEKPFAVMVLNAASARSFAALSANQIFLLESAERPVVLVKKSASCDDALPGIATGLAELGLLLPYTPLHYLLFHQLLGRPGGLNWLQQAANIVLVMTSANRGGEPLVKDDSEARASLSGLAQAYLSHDRDILQRCDDSVMRVAQGLPGEHAFQFIRRARGYTPRRILLPFSGPSVLALGGWMKNTVCVTRGDEAFVSQHIGDLAHAGACSMLEDTAAHLCDLFDIQPQIVAHDLHPDFYSSRFALSFAAQRGLPVIAVQHHHAHISAVCAEHRVAEPVLGLALDGVGLGADGSAWGGELLLVAGARFERLGHLAPIAMPGGERAAREPWRIAAAVLFQQGKAGEIATRFPNQPGAQTVAAMLQRGLNCPATSSMGRLFDAAAGLLGVSELQGYEGQAAMLLEGLAAQHGKVDALTGGFALPGGSVLDFGALLAVLADCDDAGYGAALFHATIAKGLVAWVSCEAGQRGIVDVALGGGCFLNRILSKTLTEGLSVHGLRVLTAQLLPPNDGGISLGQAWVAAQSFGK